MRPPCCAPSPAKDAPLLCRDDPERGALLMERLGSSMFRLAMPYAERLPLLCDAAARIRRPAAELELPTGAEKATWLMEFIAESWYGLDRPCAERTIAHAPVRAQRRLDAHDDERAVLVHGDVQQWNALQTTDGFKLVDPDGLFAEPEYDLGVILREDPDEPLAADLLDGEAGVDHHVEPARHGPTSSCDGERSLPTSHLLGNGLEGPRCGHRPLHEVVTDRRPGPHSDLIIDPRTQRCRIDRVGDRELDMAARTHDPGHLTERHRRIGSVHQAHERRDDIEYRSTERQLPRIGAHVRNRPVGITSSADERIGDVDGRQACAPVVEQPGVAPLPAAHIQASQPVDFGESIEKPGRVDEIAVSIGARPAHLDPGRRVGLPLGAGVGERTHQWRQNSLPSGSSIVIQ